MMVRDFFVCIAVDGRESEVTGGTGGTILISHLAMAFLVCKEWRDRGGKGRWWLAFYRLFSWLENEAACWMIPRVRFTKAVIVFSLVDDRLLYIEWSEPKRTGRTSVSFPSR